MSPTGAHRCEPQTNLVMHALPQNEKMGENVLHNVLLQQQRKKKDMSGFERVTSVVSHHRGTQAQIRKLFGRI